MKKAKMDMNVTTSGYTTGWTKWLLGVVCVGVATWLSAQPKTLEFEKPSDRFTYAQGLQRAKIYDYAEQAYREFLRLHPDHELASTAWSNMIDCQHRQGHLQEMITSIGEFRNRWKKHANLPIFTYWEGEACLQLKQLDKAQQCFEALLEEKNGTLRENSTFWLARCLFQADAASARGYELYGRLAAQPLTKDYPLREVALCELARHLHRELKYREALALYTRLADYADGRQALREEALYFIGEIHFAVNDFKAARAAYDRFLTVFPNGKWSLEVRKRRAEATYRLKQVNEALKMILEWRNMNPEADDCEMDYLHGLCLYQLGEYATAWPHFEAVTSAKNAPLEMRRHALVSGIHCLLEEGGNIAWQKGLELCGTYFRDYRDVSMEDRVSEYKGRLLENLGRHTEALAVYQQTLKILPETEKERSNNLQMRMVECHQALNQFADAAALLRKAAGLPEYQTQRTLLLQRAAGLELKLDERSQRAEEDLLRLLTYKELQADAQVNVRKQLLRLYLKRYEQVKTAAIGNQKRRQEVVGALQAENLEAARRQELAAERERLDKAMAEESAKVAELAGHVHEQLDVLLTVKNIDNRCQYLYQDALVLMELQKKDQTMVQLREALKVLTAADGRNEVPMRLLLLDLLRDKLTAVAAEQQPGAAAVPQEAKERAALLGELTGQLRVLLDKPAEQTPELSANLLFHLSELVAEQVSKTASDVDRRLLEDTYTRIIAGGFNGAAEFHAAYRLGCLYTERGDGRYRLAESVLSRMTRALMAALDAEQKDQKLLQQLGSRPENLLRNALSLLATCSFQNGNNAEAMSTADYVIDHLGVNYAASKRCLLIQARIYYEREPKNLEKAFEKVRRYCFILNKSDEKPDLADEEEAMVLLVNVQRDLSRLDNGMQQQRADGALEAYRQLKMRFPERAAREAWAAEYEQLRQNP